MDAATDIQWKVLGISRNAADGRYVPRYNPAGAAAGVISSPRTVETSFDVLRVNASAVNRQRRVNGSVESPTQVLSGEAIGGYAFGAYDGAGTYQTVAQMRAVALENIGPSATGTRLDIQVGQLANANIRLAASYTSSLNLAKWLGGQTVTYFVPVSSMAARNPSDTASLIEWNATGLGFFGSAPIAKPTVTGAKAGNAALTSLCTQLAALGLITDSTT